MTKLAVAAVLFDPTERVPRWGSVYDESWVDRLARGVRRHGPPGAELVILTDRERTFREPVTQLPLVRPEDAWCAILEVYRPDVIGEADRLMVVGLDTVFTGDFSDIALHPCRIGAIRDPLHPWVICNGITTCSPLGAHDLWQSWCEVREEAMKEHTMFGLPSEMVWLRSKFAAAERDGRPWAVLDDEFPGRMMSYKVHHPQRDAGVSIVYFHGIPKPSELTPSDWVWQEWNR